MRGIIYLFTACSLLIASVGMHVFQFNAFTRILYQATKCSAAFLPLLPLFKPISFLASSLECLKTGVC